MKPVRYLFVLLALTTAHCKSTASSSAKGFDTATLGIGAPGVNRLVWARGIEQVLPPARNLTGNAVNMNGLWYCRSRDCGDGKTGIRTGATVLTMQAARPDAEGRPMFSQSGLITYAEDPSVGANTQIKDLDPRPNEGVSYYTMLFTDPQHGELVASYYIPNSSQVASTSGGPDDQRNRLKFDMVEDGHFIRHTLMNGIQQPDYDMWRIVNADGSRTPKYALYIDDFKAKEAALTKANGGKATDAMRQLFVVVSPDSPLGRGEPIPPEDGRLPIDTSVRSGASSGSGDDASSRDSRDGAGTSDPGPTSDTHPAEAAKPKAR